MSTAGWVNLIAISALVLLILAVLKFAINGAITKRHIWQALSVVTGLVCMLLGGLSSRGNIGAWGTWVGFGGGFAVLMIALYVSRSAHKRDASSLNS
jgi:carbon starvation protein CstA